MEEKPKTDIVFSCYTTYFSSGKQRFTIFLFYPNDFWDEDKLFLEEALKKYPPDKYNWIKENDQTLSNK